MTNNETNFEAVKKAFNGIRVTKGQYTGIATCDSEGNPNVAPIGSMRVVDENTVHVLQGYLPRTFSNLRQNPKATFSVCHKPKLFDVFKDPDQTPLGYQVTCELVDIDEAETAVAAEYLQIVRRVPFLFRRSFIKFCEQNLKRLLKFKIVEVRPVGAPEM